MIVQKESGGYVLVRRSKCSQFRLSGDKIWSNLESFLTRTARVAEYPTDCMYLHEDRLITVSLKIFRPRV